MGLSSDYEQVEVGLLDPRFEEQAQIGLAADAPGLTFNVIEGMPGSGKSVALIIPHTQCNAAPSHGQGALHHLHRAPSTIGAREIFDGLGPKIARHITVHTFNDVVKTAGQEGKWGGGSACLHTLQRNCAAFGHDLETLETHTMWGRRRRPFPLTLYTELSAPK